MNEKGTATLPKRIVMVTDNGPAMKSRRYRNFIKKTEILHPRSRTEISSADDWSRRTISRIIETGMALSILAEKSAGTVERVAAYRSFYNLERLHESLDYRTPASVYLANIALRSSNLNAG